ncbi:MAG: class I SAM-dependent methyltransferase [Candidatus Binatia bacterium]
MARADETAYVGGELDLFFLATNWKRYVKAAIGEYLVGDVLEVGAGIGGTTAALHDGAARRWVCLEPDTGNAKRLRALVAERWDPATTNVVVGSLRSLAERPSFDCIVYVDVLEHIDDDRRQIEEAARLVRTGGHIVILSPAHQWLFSEFDKSIGHLRRYDKQRLQSLMPSGWKEKKMAYLDSVGVLLSLGNVLALRQAMPSRLQIAIWDRFCVPLSRIVDRLLLGNVGKSVLAVWHKMESA